MVWHTDITDGKNSKAINSEAGQEPKKFKDLMRSYWQTYCEKSTIHGVRYLYDPSVRPIERLIWSALVISCVVLTFLAYMILAERYSSLQLQTVVENSQYPVFPIPFPAVAVCTSNRVNWHKFETAKEQFLPANADTKLVDVFTTFVQRLETLRFGHFHSFGEMEDINLEALEFLNITKLIQFLAPTCADIFQNGTCRWRQIEFVCCEWFITEKTETGKCLVFNSVLSAESKKLKDRESAAYYPRHNSKAGQGTGLNFNLRLDSKFVRPNSTADDTVLIMIKKSDQWTGNGYTITPNTETYVTVRPEITNTDDSTRNLTPEQRNCIFSNELDNRNYKTLRGVGYRQDNCLNACHEEHLIQYCNCSLPAFFEYNKSVRVCQAADFRCLAKNNDIFSYDKRKEEDAYFSSAKPGMSCFCFVSCSSVEYFTSLTTLPLAEDMLSNETDTKIFKVDVHYQTEVIIMYRTSLEFTSIDLIANFGGIFGLCLGASMVSAVELLYYMTVGFGLYLYDNNYYSIFRDEVRTYLQRLKGHYRNSVVDNEHQPPYQRNHRPSFMQRHPHLKKNVW